MSLTPDRCRSCGAPIRFARHMVTGSIMPLDWGVTFTGRWTIDQAGRARHNFNGPGHAAHWATCPDAAANRRKRGAD